MQKNKIYRETRFSADVIKEANAVFLSISEKNGKRVDSPTLELEHDDSKWSYDDIDEYLSDYRKYQKDSRFSAGNVLFRLIISVIGRWTSVSVGAPSRPLIETVFEVFEKHLAASKLPPLPAAQPTSPKPVVFIGHGRSGLWRELKDHLQDKHGIDVVAYETGARAGHTIRDILEEMANQSSFALLVLTAEDEQPDGTFRARPNVIHETGLFQGRLGFSRAVVLLEDGAEQFSNIDGVQQIRFGTGNIKETFGEVVATIRREFGR